MNCSKRIAIACMAAITITAAGCGEVTLSPDAATSDSGPGQDVLSGPCEGDVALDDAWQCLVDQVCEIIMPCYGGSLTVAECRELDVQIWGLSSRYGDVLLQGGVAQGSLSYDGVAMAACLDMLAQTSCDDLYASGDPFAQCQPFAGTIADDDVCYLDLECATPGADCRASVCEGELCCQGTCVAPAPVGSSCLSRPCVPGAHCVNDACTAGVTNDACRFASDCDTDHWCDPDGLCQPDHATAEACTNDSQCTAPEVCVGDAIGGGTCMRASQPGDPCDNACLPVTSLYCDRPDATTLGTCEPRLGEGSACDPEWGGCQFGLRCDAASRVCIAAQQLNQACDQGLPCDFFAGLHCTTEIDNSATGVCRGPLAAGQACALDSHCLSGHCYQQVCTDVTACY